MRMDAAGGAEAVLDDVLAEEIVLQRALALGESQVRAWHEPQRRALAMAHRAVAHDDALDIALDLVGDGTAVTASLVEHVRPLLV